MPGEPELAAWLRLGLTPGLGGARARALLSSFGLPEAVLSASPEALARHVPRDVVETMRSSAVDARVETALRWIDADRHHVVVFPDPVYPRLLLETADPPLLIFANGRIELLGAAAIAIVGSRNCTPQGARIAEGFAQALSDAGLTVVSGLAGGIDASAHRGALAGRSSTIAVLGTGIDVVYPATNKPLAARIAEQGLLLSEFALGAPPAAAHFPRRNRVISGLSLGCLVVEAALASGSLITARAALEQGREVFAVPGSIHSPVSKGCHALIREGAKLTETASDVLVELKWATQPQALPESRPACATLVSQMGFDPVDLETLCERTGRSAAEVTAELLQLELAGAVASMPGGRFQRIAG